MRLKASTWSANAPDPKEIRRAAATGESDTMFGWVLWVKERQHEHQNSRFLSRSSTTSGSGFNVYEVKPTAGRIYITAL